MSITFQKVYDSLKAAYNEEFASNSTQIYLHAAEQAIKTQSAIHLSHKRNEAPLTAFISPQGKIFLAQKETLETTSFKIVKFAYDVFDQKPVVRLIAEKCEPITSRRASEERAREILKDCPWMLKEHFSLLYHSEGVEKFAVIRELMDDDLYEILGKPIDRATKRGYARQLLKQLKDIHERKGVHADIRAENVLVSGPTLKLFDFDFFFTTDEKKDGFAIGLIEAMPPEYAAIMPDSDALCWKRYTQEHASFLKTSPQFRTLNTQALDVWATGLILHEIFSGSGLFWERQDYPIRRLIEAIKTFRPETSLSPRLNKKERTLLEGMLHPDPAQRWTAESALQFFNENF